ncbi:hypothetical protein ACC690_38340, partial [Rhizobium johnstonii]
FAGIRLFPGNMQRDVRSRLRQLVDDGAIVELVEDASELKAKGNALGLGLDAMNSNTFSDAPGQAHSYKYGSLSHTDAATRAQAV